MNPPVTWAQRNNLVYLTICLEDCKDPVVKIDNEKLYFKGNGGTEKKDYEVTLTFFDKIKADESKFIVRDRGTEFVLYKEEEKWWTRLLNENKKFHWLKVDFNKWKDEDDSGDENGFNDNSYEDMMRQFGGGGMGGAPDFGNFNIDGMAGMPGEDEKDEEDEDETLPELE